MALNTSNNINRVVSLPTSISTSDSENQMSRSFKECPRHLTSVCSSHLNTHHDLELAKVSDDGRFFFFNDDHSIEVHDSFKGEKV